MKKYMIGKKDGKKYVAHMTEHDAAVFDSHTAITKAEYRRHRAAGIPSFGEVQTDAAKQASRKDARALHWKRRAAQARKDASDADNLRNLQEAAKVTT